MFLNLIIKEYNINIINLNYLLQENIETEIGNYLFDNNLKLKINSRDLNKLIFHFLNEEIIKQLKEDYNNILIFNPEIKLKTLHNLYAEEDCILLLQKIIKKSTKIFNYSLFEISTNFVIDNNNIYSLKKFLQQKKSINYKKLKNFCESSNLRFLGEKVGKDLGLKNILHK
jgi:hypothetical protein